MEHNTPAHPKISLEEFIYYYRLAFMRENVKALEQLDSIYPDLCTLAFQTTMETRDSLQSDWDTSYCLHPVVTGNHRMTERKVLDMVAYLLCKAQAPTKYKRQLHKTSLPAREVFNPCLDRFQYDYDRDELWERFFM